MKIETWYDLGCDICGRHRSTDFEKGLRLYRKGFSSLVKEEGWKFKDGKNICPICVKEEEKKIKSIKTEIPKEYMFEKLSNGCAVRTPSPVAKALFNTDLEDIKCPCCGEKNLRIKDYGYDSMFPEYQVGCDSCDWDSPTGTISDYGEAPCEFKHWLEAFELLGRPAERVNEDLTLLFYPEEDGWREKEREERKNYKEE